MKYAEHGKKLAAEVILLLPQVATPPLETTVELLGLGCGEATLEGDEEGCGLGVGDGLTLIVPTVEELEARNEGFEKTVFPLQLDNSKAPTPQ